MKIFFCLSLLKKELHTSSNADQIGRESSCLFPLLVGQLSRRIVSLKNHLTINKINHSTSASSAGTEVGRGSARNAFVFDFYISQWDCVQRENFTYSQIEKNKKKIWKTKIFLKLLQAFFNPIKISLNELLLTEFKEKYSIRFWSLCTANVITLI